MADAQATAAEKVKTEYEDVAMSDGRTVKFPGKRQIQKEPVKNGDDVGIRFDFRNGQTMTLWTKELSGDILEKSVLHGLSQKCGDEAAGEKNIADIASAVEDMMSRLRKGEWRVARAAGDSFAGTHIVVRAVAEVSGKTVEEVKAFLQSKLDKAKEAGQALSRQELYAGLRKPGGPFAATIERLEKEEAAGKSTKVSADDLLSELAGA